MKNSLHLLLSLLMLWNCSIAQAQASFAESINYGLTHDEYEAIQVVAEKILAMHSPEDSIFIGVGRSPTPVIIFLELLHPGSTRFLPFSDASTLFENARERPAIAEYIKNHFDNFLGDLAKGPKKLVFIDFVASFGGFRYMLALVEKHFQDQPGFQFDYVALKNNKDYVQYFGDNISAFIDMPKWPAEEKIIVPRPALMNGLFSSRYDYISLYGFWFPEHKTEIPYTAPVKNQIAYDHFKSLIREEMLLDYILIPDSCTELFRAKRFSRARATHFKY